MKSGNSDGGKCGLTGMCGICLTGKMWEKREGQEQPRCVYRPVANRLTNC